MNKVKYYVIHNLDKNRYENILYLFSKYGVDLKDVTFINHPNKNELTYEIKKKAVQKGSKIKDGWISCSYKHYLAIEKIVENGVICRRTVLVLVSLLIPIVAKCNMKLLCTLGRVLSHLSLSLESSEDDISVIEFSYPIFYALRSNHFCPFVISVNLFVSFHYLRTVSKV